MGHTSEKSRKNQPPSELTTAPLFPDLELGQRPRERTYGRIGQAIWTDNKANFIRQYLAYFVQVTKHGAYIDGFAGPQSFEKLDAWTAALVLRGEPKWLRHFFLCEITRKGVRALKQLEAAERAATDRRGKKLFRNIEILHGDFNAEVNRILASGKITQKEATFCLLDQRTFECHWSTLQALASYKKAPENKIELLYFLGVGWIHRAISGIRRPDRMLRWWGRADWKELSGMRSHDIAELVRKRFRTELGYRYVAAYPIFDREKSNKVMYYMVHASDHGEAPALMVRAHRKAVRALPKDLQRPLFEARDDG